MPDTTIPLGTSGKQARAFDTGAGVDQYVRVVGSVSTGLTQPTTPADTQPVSGTVSVNALPAGTNNIGDVDVLTLPALPAGTNTIGAVKSAAPMVVRQWGQFYALRGQRFIATTGYVAGTQNASTPLALLRNPTGSGKWVILDQAEFGSSLDSRFSRYGGGTAGSIGTKQPVGVSDGGSSTAVAELYRGGSSGAQYAITAAGTLRKVATMRAYATYQILQISGTAILRPGQQAYWTMDEPVGGGNGSYEAFIDFEWVEIPEATGTALAAAMAALSEY